MNLRTVLFTTGFVVSCISGFAAQAQGPAPIKIASIEFTSTPAPSSMMEMAAPYTRSQAIVTLADGSKKTFPLAFQVLQRSGDYVPGWYYGLIVDKRGEPILQSPPNSKGNVARGPFFSAGADGMSLLRIPNASVDGVKGHTVFLINHLEFETDAPNMDPKKPPVGIYAALPMAMNLTVLDQDPATGALTPVRMSNIDMSAVDGLWIPCNSSVTP
jgi:hypothetical protein